MADGYQYVLEMVDKISGPALNARGKIDALAKSMKAGVDASMSLRNAQAALGATGGLTADVEKKLNAEIAKQEKAAQGAAAKVRDMVEADRKLTSSKLDASKATQSLGGQLAAIGPYAAAAAAALLVIVGLLAGGGALALGAAKFKANTVNALRSVEGVGDEAPRIFKELRRLSDEMGIAESKAQALGLTLLDAGVAQSDLADSIRAIATLEKVRGADAAKKIEELIKKSAAAGSFKFDEGALEGSGVSKTDVVSALAKRLGKDTKTVEDELKKGAIKAAEGIAALNDALGAKGMTKGLGSIDTIGVKAMEKLSRLFEDVNVGPFLDGLSELLKLFDENTISGAALKFLATSIFDGLFAAAKEVFPYIKIAFYELIIVALKLYIALKPVIGYMKELWASASQGEDMTNVIRTVVNVLVGLAVVLAVIVGAALAFGVAISVGFYYLITVLGQASAAVSSFVSGAWESLKSIFSVEGATSLAMNLINGLIAGITGGGAGVAQALIGVGQGAINSVKSVLGIASPSKVMEGLGAFTAEGFAQGVEGGAADAQGAMQATVAPPTAARAPGGGGGGLAVTIGNITIQGVGASGNVQADVKQGVLDAFEQLAMQLGGAVAPSPG